MRFLLALAALAAVPAPACAQALAEQVKTARDVFMGGLTSGYYTARDKFYDMHAATLWEDNHVTKVQLNFDLDVPDEVQQELFQSVIASYSSPRMRL